MARQIRCIALRRALVLAAALTAHIALSAEFPADMKQPAGRISPKEMEETKRDPLVIGGKARSSLMEFQFDDRHSDFMLNPSRLEVYMDATRSNNIRLLTRASMTYDPTIDENTTDIITGQRHKKTDGQLDEFKLMFPAQKKAFFTIGKQKIRWGSGHFFNPTDFLNSAVRDPLQREDERSGVSLFKAHVPLGRSNFYLVNKWDDIHRMDMTAVAGRLETAFKSSEIALSAVSQKSKPSRYGVDISLALWKADFYVESAFQTTSSLVKYGPDNSPNAPSGSYQTYTDDKLKNFAATTTGISYEVKYGQNHTLTLVGEYFNNPEGYRYKEDYVYSILAGAYQPFHIGQDYAMFVMILPKPGTFHNIDLSAINLANLSDRSYLSRLTLRSDVLGDLIMEFDITHHYGDARGEMRMGGLRWDYNAQLEMSF